MTLPLPVLLHYAGEGEFRPPNPYWAKVCDRQFAVGENVLMERREDRSIATHNHEFAWLRDAWMNLPEHLAELYPSPEHLRKRGLIQAGYYNEQIVDAGTNAAAIRVASAFRSRDDFLLVIVRGPLVVIREAKSQSRRAMDKREFQESKTKLMAVVAEMIGVAPNSLTQEAGKAA